MTEDQNISVSGPGGIGASITGQNVLGLVVLAAALGVMILSQHWDRQAALKNVGQVLSEMRAEHGRIIDGCGKAR